MLDNNEFKIEQILSELPEDKRKILKDHIDELSGKEREDFLEEVITEYEALKNKSGISFTEAAKKLNETPEKKLSEEPEAAVKEATLEDVLKEGNKPVHRPEIKPEDISFDVVPSENTSASAIKNVPAEEIQFENALTEVTYTDDLAESDNAEEETLPVETKAPEVKPVPGIEPVSPIRTENKKKKPIAGIIIGAAAALIVAGGLLYAFVLPKSGKPEATEPAITTTESETSALPTPTPEPIPTTESTEETTPAPTEVPTPTPIPLKENAPDLKGIKVVIDPGHQQTTDYKKEQFKKGTKNGKARATSGAVGIATQQKEYELTMETALMLKEYLEKCGATVILTRTENNVNISNKERAAIAVKAKPTLFIRLHADAGNTSSVKGVKVYIPKSGKLNKTADAKKLGKLVASAAKTKFIGVKATNQYTGLNFASSIRSYQIVLGYLSNAEDDKRLADPENRYEMCAAIATFCKNFKKK